MDIAKGFKQMTEVLQKLDQYSFGVETKSKFETMLKSVKTLQNEWKNKKINDGKVQSKLIKLQRELIDIFFASTSSPTSKIIGTIGKQPNEIIEQIYDQLLPGKSPASFWESLPPHVNTLTNIGDFNSINIESEPLKGVSSFLKNIKLFKNKASSVTTKGITTGSNSSTQFINKIELGPKVVKKSSKPKKLPVTRETAPQSVPVKKHTSRAKPPMRETTVAEVPAPNSEGKILYDIPDAMIVNRSQKCTVRIGESEAIVRDNDSFSKDVKVEDVKLSGKMQVELIDISDPQKFRIKTFSAAKQFFEQGSFTEWIFTVTALESGTFPLYLKASVIKIINNEEVPHEIIFEKSINITTTVADNQGLIMNATFNLSQPKNEAPVLKDLSKETKVVALPTPKIFISYAHNDKIYFDIFLSNFQSQSGWQIWTDRNIEIGANWFNSIQQSMQQSDCAVLLISSDFISSAFIKEHEFQKFNKLKESKPGFIFLPILLRDCDFTRWQDLSRLQMFSALGGDYNVHSKETKLIPFADLCSFFDNGLLKPNPNIDTYFKNLVMQANKQWIEINKPST